MGCHTKHILLSTTSGYSAHPPVFKLFYTPPHRSSLLSPDGSISNILPRTLHLFHYACTSSVLPFHRVSVLMSSFNRSLYFHLVFSPSSLIVTSLTFSALCALNHFKHVHTTSSSPVLSCLWSMQNEIYKVHFLLWSYLFNMFVTSCPHLFSVFESRYNRNRNIIFYYCTKK